MNNIEIIGENLMRKLIKKFLNENFYNLTFTKKDDIFSFIRLIQLKYKLDYNERNNLVNSFNEFIYIHLFQDIFKKFLSEKGITEQYIFNFKYALSSKIYSIKCIKNISPTFYISSAFNWAKTNEGYTFWKNLHYDWLTYIKPFEKILFKLRLI